MIRILLNKAKHVLFLALGFISMHSFGQTVSDSLYEIPELVFRNPSLIAGTAGKEGATYKFSNVAPGIDGQIKLKKFSDPAIVVANIDNSSFGFDKAFQPEFGMNPVKKNQNWYIDFELTFWNAGTTAKRKIDKFTLTSLDVDGDNFNVQEYVVMQKASSVTYSTVTFLGNGGITSVLPTCDVCGKQSVAIPCVACGGTGLTNKGKGKSNKCTVCDGVGKLYALCGHPFDGQDATVQGPTDNFTNIDTSATGVMASYVYNNKDAVNFRIGAQSGNKDGGAGVRLNSIWFKGFNLAPSSALPVKISNFTATYNKENVVLNWAASEINFSHYVLQRSTDGKNYFDIATIFAAQTSAYAYKDANTTSVTNTLFYRLKMVDNTGEFVYSEVKIIRLTNEKEALSVSAYPNPVNNQLHVTLPAAWQGKTVSFELYNANGSRVQSLNISKASQTENLNMASLTKGFYVIKVVCNDASLEQRIVKN